MPPALNVSRLREGSPDPRGATWDGMGVNFSLFSAHATKVELCLFDSSGQRGIRRVIDVSGDGANNSGQLVVVARDEVVSKGITINGLPVMLKRPSYSTMDIELLDEYYEDCVIGGPAAFVVAVKDREKFVEAIRTQLVLEVAGLTPPAAVMKASAANPRVPCTVGERMWQERWGN